jgi:hypothetical protein
MTAPVSAELASNRPPPRTELVSLFGASLLSAVGSLSLHIAPIVTIVMIADARTSVAGAGWVRSLSLMGEFAAAISLPLLGALQLGRKAALATAIALIAGIALAASHNALIFQAGWLVIGISSGVFKYLGVMAASKSSRLALAFTLRLSVVLILAGSVSAVLVAVNSLASYQALLEKLSIVLLAMLAIGIALYRGPAVEPTVEGGTSSARRQRKPTLFQLSGLLVVYCFFASISGVLIYSLHQAVDRGLTASDAIWALALTKIAAGVWLMVASWRAKKAQRDGFLILACLLAASTIAIFQSWSIVMLFASLLLWEIAANNLSARLQAAVVANAPDFAGKWLNFNILLGGVTGPLLNGIAISFSSDVVYVAFAAVAAFAPVLWHYWILSVRNGAMATVAR